MPRLLADLTPLRVSPAYRRLWIGNALSSVGTQLTLVAVSLEVYHLTGSSLYVGLLGAFAVVPLVIAGLYGGAVADTYDRRTVALGSSLVLWLTSVAIAAHAWAGIESVWVLYALTAVHSGASGINQPTRGAIIPALVGVRLLPAANALNMMTMSLSLMVRPRGTRRVEPRGTRRARRRGPGVAAWGSAPSSRVSGSWPRARTCG